MSKWEWGNRVQQVGVFKCITVTQNRLETARNGWLFRWTSRWIGSKKSSGTSWLLSRVHHLLTLHVGSICVTAFCQRAAAVKPPNKKWGRVVLSHQSLKYISFRNKQVNHHRHQWKRSNFQIPKSHFVIPITLWCVGMVARDDIRVSFIIDPFLWHGLWDLLD